MHTPLHENNNYTVELASENSDGNYAVVNKITDATEYLCKSLPQAKVTAEQYNFLLEHDYHTVIMEQMFGDDYSQAGFQLALVEDSDPPEGIH